MCFSFVPHPPPLPLFLKGLHIAPYEPSSFFSRFVQRCRDLTARVLFYFLPCKAVLPSFSVFWWIESFFPFPVSFSPIFPSSIISARFNLFSVPWFSPVIPSGPGLRLQEGTPQTQIVGTCSLVFSALRDLFPFLPLLLSPQ